MPKKSETQIFADDRPTSLNDDLYQWAVDAEDMLRQQHTRILELEARLKGVSNQPPVAWVVTWPHFGDGSTYNIFYGKGAGQSVEHSVKQGDILGNQCVVTPLYSSVGICDSI